MNIAVVVVKENDTECCSLMECLLIMCDMLLIANHLLECFGCALFRESSDLCHSVAFIYCCYGVFFVVRYFWFCKKVIKPLYVSSWETHLTATGHHLSYEITQCYLPPDTGERTPS